MNLHLLLKLRLKLWVNQFLWFILKENHMKMIWNYLWHVHICYIQEKYLKKIPFIIDILPHLQVGDISPTKALQLIISR